MSRLSRPGGGLVAKLRAAIFVQESSPQVFEMPHPQKTPRSPIRLIIIVPVVVIAIVGVSIAFAAKSVDARADKNLSLDSKVEIAPEGDLNHNNQLDAGETARFTFSINNATNNTIKLAKLNTKVPSESIFLITKLYGTPNLDNSKKFITLPNLRIGAHQNLSVYFDAVMQYPTADQQVTHGSELLDDRGKAMASGQDRQITLKRGALVQPSSGQVNATVRKAD